MISDAVPISKPNPNYTSLVSFPCNMTFDHASEVPGIRGTHFVGAILLLTTCKF